MGFLQPLLFNSVDSGRPVQNRAGKLCTELTNLFTLGCLPNRSLKKKQHETPKLDRKEDNLEDPSWTDPADTCMFFSHTCQLNFILMFVLNDIYPPEKVGYA